MASAISADRARRMAVIFTRVNPDELRQDAKRYIRTEVARGRETCVGIVTGTIEHLYSSRWQTDLATLAWELVPAEFAAHLEAQSMWPERTDSDKLTDAFRALDAAGIVAREDFTCCQTCGLNDIDDEVVDPASTRGYVFYHGQDAQSAADGGGLWLAYGLLEEEPTPEIGEEIASALRAEGLEVDWDGSPEERIHVPMRWARRRHGRMAAYPTGDPAQPAVAVQFDPDRWVPAMSASALAELELPWLAEGESARVGEMVLRRRRHELVCEDGRVAGRFDGLRLLLGEDVSGGVPEEPGLIEVTYDNSYGVRQYQGRPMELREIVDVLRRLPTRTDSWLSALHDAGCVQVRWKNGRLWLETPNPTDQTSTGKYATLEEAERMLTILAVEHRNGVTELDGVTTTPW
jgi:hypothetical protein